VEDVFPSALLQQQLAVQQTVSLLDKRSRQGATGKHISAARLHVTLVGLEFGSMGPTRAAPHPRHPLPGSKEPTS
jgi:hypothetical protein